VKREVPDDDPRGVPDDSWLYRFPGAWRINPRMHPKQCSWCESDFDFVPLRWRICPICDAPEKKDEDRKKKRK